MAVGATGQVDRGGIEPTDHGASATALDVMHPRPSLGLVRIGNRGDHITPTLEEPAQKLGHFVRFLARKKARFITIPLALG